MEALAWVAIYFAVGGIVVIVGKKETDITGIAAAWPALFFFFGFIGTGLAIGLLICSPFFAIQWLVKRLT